ncbi:MAG: DUF1559 domain-containing protein [Planctomycetaceae bacterium]
MMSSNPYIQPETPPAPVVPKRSWMTPVELLVVLSIILVLVGLLLPALSRGGGRQAARRVQCKNNLKQIGIALHQYRADFGCFPPTVTTADDGTVMHSWRTLLLPYLDQKQLYESIDLSRPWDDPVNSEAARQYVSAYRCPSANGSAEQTTYLAVTGPGTFFPPPGPEQFDQPNGNISDVVMVIELDSAAAVSWMAPVDWVADRTSDAEFPHSGGAHVLLGDGRVLYLTKDEVTANRLAMVEGRAITTD